MRATVLLVLLLAAALAACGTTRIRTSDPAARVYVDGELVGVGGASIRQRGLPHTATIAVVAPSGARATRTVSRSFTATTAASFLLLSWVGLVAMWELPSEIDVPLPAGSSWDDAPAGDDVWSHPPAWADRR